MRGVSLSLLCEKGVAKVSVIIIHINILQAKYKDYLAT